MSEAPSNVCIGILARNEADGIGDLIADLGEQTLITDSPHFSIQMFVVANGCTDETSEVARLALANPPFSQHQIVTAVHDVDRPGKSNAWNHFVHSVVPVATDYVFFLDGDIRIPDPGSLKLVLEALMTSPQAVVAVDRSVKDIELENPTRAVEKLIKASTGTANDPRTAIAGACYCVRYSEAQKIWMPIGLPGEDGFLRAMLLTSSFAHEELIHRHLYVQDAYHVFESLREVRQVIKHNVRLAIGTAINILLFHHLRRLRVEGQDIADYIRRRNVAEPDWVNCLVGERLRVSYFPLEKRFVMRRLRRIMNEPENSSITNWAIALLGTGFDFIVFLRATALMRKGAGAGFW